MKQASIRMIQSGCVRVSGKGRSYEVTTPTFNNSVIQFRHCYGIPTEFQKCMHNDITTT